MPPAGFPFWKVHKLLSLNGEKYLGKRYEIAWLDFKYEKNLNNVTATYSKADEGMIRVDNRGYNFVKKEWKQSVGKAKFTV